MKTSYYNYAQYLQANQKDLYGLLEKFIAFPSNDPSLWHRFEENLANLDVDQILDENSMYLPNIASDDFRDRDLHAFPYALMQLKDQLTENLFESFENFIREAVVPKSAFEKKIHMHRDALFLNFNYTRTLEKLYDIDKKNILYIHNNAFYGPAIILGHGVSPDKFDQTPDPPDGLTPEEYEQWIEKQSEDYDYSYDTGVESIMEYFKDTFKPTEEIIMKNHNFFLNVAAFDEIHVYGHSMSEVDIKYFETIAKNAKPNVKWVISYYSNQNIYYYKQVVKTLVITNVVLVQLQDFQINNSQLKFDF